MTGKMKILLPAMALMLSCGARAQEGLFDRTLNIDTAVVAGRRALEGIGEQRTELDTAALRENITNSLADVLSHNSSIFIKSYGRATLSTASFRGTAPSHTQVTWNGMKLNSPMLGTVDFSMIPSYFVDRASLYHGASSVGTAGGGLGGAVSLSTRPEIREGAGLRYVQGVGSYNTFDEFLRFDYGSGRLRSSTRVYYASSDNDFKYTNYRKKEFRYDEAGNIDGFVYPVERNRNGDFHDLHLMQDIFLFTPGGDNFSVSAWYLDSRRGVPMLNVDYSDDDLSKTEQNERTLRTVVNWTHDRPGHKLEASAGYNYTDLQYLYLGDLGDGEFTEMIHSRSFVNTAYAKLGGEAGLGSKWLLSGNISLHQHFVKSVDNAVVSNDGGTHIMGYNKYRTEISALAGVKYRPSERWAFALDLREEMYGEELTPLIPAVFGEYLLRADGSLKLKASGARNFRYPTLNDLYFMPGGNDTLRSEKGYTYDAGIEFRKTAGRSEFHGEVAWYDSHINDWIVWLPTFKGFWTPVNVKEVHSYGVELKAGVSTALGTDWKLDLDGNFTLTNAINRGDPVNWADRSIGRQLVYIPKYSAAVAGRLRWRGWTLAYKWNYYSKRYTTSSNETATKVGVLGDYFMNDAALEKRFTAHWGDLSLKLAVNNLFGEEYESVLSRPMAGRNFGIYIEITPRKRIPR